MARSRSGTRNMRGPRKPQRRPDQGQIGQRGADARAGPARCSRDSELDHRQGACRAARRQRRGRHPRADQERHLRQHQPAARSRHGQPRDRRARLRGRRGRLPEKVERQRRCAHTAGHQGSSLRGRRSQPARAAAADRDRHGPRRPRQDQPARRHAHHEHRRRRARRHHPAHRRQRDHQGRPRRSSSSTRRATRHSPPCAPVARR